MDAINKYRASLKDSVKNPTAWLIGIIKDPGDLLIDIPFWGNLAWVVPACQVRVSRFYQCHQTAMATATASSRSQWAPNREDTISMGPPGPNCEGQISVGTAGPQLQAPDFTELQGPTSARKRSARMPEEMSRRMPDAMSEDNDITDRMPWWGSPEESNPLVFADSF